MEKIVYDGEYFCVEDTLLCGQLFRYKSAGQKEKGFYLTSKNKRCLCYNEGKNAVIECEKNDAEYFRRYFDLDRDYSLIAGAAERESPAIAMSAKLFFSPNSAHSLSIMPFIRGILLFCETIKENNASVLS